MKGDYGTARVIGREDVDSDLVLSADQGAGGGPTGRGGANNQRLRELKVFEGKLPQAGDKLVLPAQRPFQGPPERFAVEGDDGVARDGEARGINLLVSPEEDDPDRGVSKIKLMKAAFEDPDSDVPWQQKKRYGRFRFRLCADRAQGAGLAMGRGRPVRREFSPSARRASAGSTRR